MSRPDTTRFERVGDALVFHAGRGEWYNQPHNKRWDMGEDVADIPPAQWHLDIQRAIDSQEQELARVVIDFTGMFSLVGRDWGFLVRLSKQMQPRGWKLLILGSERITSVIRILGLGSWIDVCHSLEESPGQA